MLEIWRTASRFDSARGGTASWAMTIAHRRAVDRGRSENAAAERVRMLARGPVTGDDVAELAETALGRQRVRRCMGTLTALQAEAVTLVTPIPRSRGCSVSRSAPSRPASATA
ncbi:MAG: sigma factor [Streptosporangiaceae bacterium]|jgi:RNA polymerase sigma-70 factor (ECF subfamily)